MIGKFFNRKCSFPAVHTLPNSDPIGFHECMERFSHFWAFCHLVCILNLVQFEPRIHSWYNSITWQCFHDQKKRGNSCLTHVTEENQVWSAEEKDKSFLLERRHTDKETIWIQRSAVWCCFMKLITKESKLKRKPTNIFQHYCRFPQHLVGSRLNTMI